MSSTPFARLIAELHSLRVALERLRVTLETLTHVAGDHEARVRVLERQQARLAPIVAALTFLLGALMTEVMGRLW
jgi:CHAD domain-containing protein